MMQTRRRCNPPPQPATRRPCYPREVRGPAPNSFAVIAGPPKARPAEKNMAAMRQQEWMRHQAEKQLEEMRLFKEKTEWERHSEKRLILSEVRRRVNERMSRDEFNVEERRERLRELLSCEQAAYEAEMNAQQETTVERQAKMRERAKQLKERREAERLAVVHEKLDQQWREQCEELRDTMSKREQDIVAAERFKQMEIKEREKEQERADEQLYVQLWQEDIRAQVEREEREAHEKMLSDRSTVGVLQKQMAALEAHKQRERELVQEDAALLKEQEKLRKVEDEKIAHARRMQQAQTRDMLDQSIRDKRRREARKMQEELAFDLKMLEQLLSESTNEAIQIQQRKRELREEDRTYRQYLARMKEEEAAREAELERACDAEVEKNWQKKIAQWKLQSEVRRRLLDDVISVRNQQLQQRRDHLREKKAQGERDREELKRKIAESEAQTERERQDMAEQQARYVNDLLGQMDYNQRARQAAAEEERRQRESELEADREYYRKLQDVLHSITDVNVHPMRASAARRQQQRRPDSNPLIC